MKKRKKKDYGIYAKPGKREENMVVNKTNFFYYMVILAVIVAILIFVFVKNGNSFDFSAKRNTGSSGSGTGITTDVSGLNDLRITFMDIGQGDAALINFPDGKNMLIDAGDNNKTVRNTLDKYLTVDGKKLTLDYVVATHPDADHIGSIGYVYENYDVKYSFRPYVKSNYSPSEIPSEFNGGKDIKNSTKAYYTYLKGAYADTPSDWSFFTDKSDFTNKITVDGDETSYEYTVDFMMPYVAEPKDFDKFSYPNDFSSVTMISYAGRKILFTGDIGNQHGDGSEAAFVKAYSGDPASVDCDVLKVAHHGSESSSTKEFLNLVKPEYAVISCGIGNKYDHPRAEAVSRIQAIQSSVSADGTKTGLYRTDIHGTIILTIDKDGKMTFTAETNANDAYLFSDGKEIAENKDKIKK